MSPPKHVDLLVLALAAVVFVVADLPLLGYAAGAVAWLSQRAVQWLAERRSGEALKAGNRQRAMGIIGATTLGRVWLMATIVLVVGIVQNSAGLSSAVLVAALFTISMASSGIAYLLAPESGSVQPR